MMMPMPMNFPQMPMPGTPGAVDPKGDGSQMNQQVVDQNQLIYAMAYHQQQMQQYQAMIAQNMAMQMMQTQGANGTGKTEGAAGQNQVNPFAMGMNPQMNQSPMGGFPMMPPMPMPGAMPPVGGVDPSQAQPMMPMMGMPMMYPPFPNANQTQNGFNGKGDEK